MKIKITLCQVSKLIFILFFFYEMILRRTIIDSNVLSYTILGTALLFQLAYDRRVVWYNSIFCWFAFFIVSITSAFIVATNAQRAVVYLVLFIKYVIASYLIMRYCEVDKDILFSIRVFICASVFIAFLVVTIGFGEYRLTYSQDVNVNSIGVTLMFAIAYILYVFIRKEKKPLTIAVNISIILFLTYVIIRTVSKKAIIGDAFIILFWLIVCYGNAFRKMNPIRRVFILALICAIGYFGYEWFINEKSSVFQYVLFRFGRLNANDNGSTSERLFLINEGFKLFIDNPILGIGYNNYIYHNYLRMYSHCFYIELLACTGVIGTVLFSIPMIRAFHNLRNEIRMSRINKDVIQMTELRYILIIYIALLLISFTQIIFYEFELMYVMSTIVAGSEVFKQGKRPE